MYKLGQKDIFRTTVLLRNKWFPITMAHRIQAPLDTTNVWFRPNGMFVWLVGDLRSTVT